MLVKKCLMICLLCIQSTIMIGSQITGKVVCLKRTSGPKRTQTPPISVTGSNRMIRFDKEAKLVCSPSDPVATGPLDYFSVFYNEGNSPSPYDYKSGR